MDRHCYYHVRNVWEPQYRAATAIELALIVEEQDPEILRTADDNAIGHLAADAADWLRYGSDVIVDESELRDALIARRRKLREATTTQENNR